jgi:hypothetical protein
LVAPILGLNYSYLHNNEKKSSVDVVVEVELDKKLGLGKNTPLQFF